MTVDPSEAGSAMLLVNSSHPNARITLILPDGLEVAAGNRHGYEFTAPSSTSAASEGNDLLLGDLAKGMTIIELPKRHAAGVYKVHVDTRGIPEPTAVAVMYQSSSPIVLGARAPGYSYRIGDKVILSALLVNGQQPVRNAQVTGSVQKPQDVTRQVSAVGFHEIRRTRHASGDVELELGMSLRNSGAPLEGVQVHALSADPAVIVEPMDETLVGNLASGAIKPLPTPLAVRLPQGRTFSPALLKWSIISSSPDQPLTFADAGPNDARPGDGAYTAIYAPTSAGRHEVTVHAAGQAGGHPFSRTAVVEFDVIETTATLSKSGDKRIDVDGNGRAEGITVDVAVTTSRSGSYILQGKIHDAQGREIGSANAAVNLPVGNSTVHLDFNADAQWPDHQPLMLVDFMLIADDPDDTIVAHVPDAGTTGTYVFERPALALSGVNSSETIGRDGPEGAETLRILVGVAPPITTRDVSCSWSGHLLPMPPAGTPDVLISGNFESTPPVSVIPFEVRMSQIRAARLQGPYRLANIHILCQGRDALNRWLSVSEPGDVFTTPAR